MPRGRRADAKRELYAQRFGIVGRVRKILTVRMMERLDSCNCDEARRLLLFSRRKDANGKTDSLS